jgi:hypothetical protein
MGRCAVFFLALTGCGGVDIPPPEVRLREYQTNDLLRHPRKWHRHIVTLKLYPFDRGWGRTNTGWAYPVCFEPCDRAEADRSVFAVLAREGRFKGFTDTRPAVVRVRFDACNVEWACADFWGGWFVEVE